MWGSLLTLDIGKELHRESDGLRVGQQILAEVIKRESDRIVLKIMGQRLTAYHSIELSPGQKLPLIYQGNKGQSLVFKLASAGSEVSSPSTELLQELGLTPNPVRHKVVTALLDMRMPVKEASVASLEHLLANTPSEEQTARMEQALVLLKSGIKPEVALRLPAGPVSATSWAELSPSTDSGNRREQADETNRETEIVSTKGPSELRERGQVNQSMLEALARMTSSSPKMTGYVGKLAQVLANLNATEEAHIGPMLDGLAQEIITNLGLNEVEPNQWYGLFPWITKGQLWPVHIRVKREAGHKSQTNPVYNIKIGADTKYLGKVFAHLVWKNRLQSVDLQVESCGLDKLRQHSDKLHAILPHTRISIREIPRDDIDSTWEQFVRFLPTDKAIKLPRVDLRV